MKKIPEIRFPEFSGEWVEKEFNNIFKTISTKQYQIKNSEIYTKGLYPVVDQGKNRIAGYSDNSNKLLKNKGIIVFGDHTTILKYIDFDFIVGADGVKLLKNKYVIHNLKFLYYSLKFNNIKPEGYKRHFSILKQLKLHIPPTLAEQEKIAEFLSSIDEKIEITAKKIEKLMDYKKGLLQKMLRVTEKGEPELRFKEFSGKWVGKRLGEIGKIYQPKTISEKDFMKNGYPVYGANGKIGYYKEYNHETWQVMITCRGSTCGTINKSEDKSWITGNSMVVNVDDNTNIDKNFLYYILQIQKFLRIIEGSGQPQITQKSLQSFKLHIPPTLAEQEKIAKFLSSIDKKIELEENRLEKLKEYKKGLLQKMFV